MAGIGFELKKLFNAKGIISKLRAYGYTGIVTSGPMILGMMFLLAITYIGRESGLDDFNRDLLISLITYSLLFSLTITSLLSMVNTRYISDMLYDGEHDLILPSLEGLLSILIPITSLLTFIVLFFAKLNAVLSVITFIFVVELIIVWIEMNYLSAIKNYKGIVISYVISITIAIIVAYIMTYFFGAHIEILLGSVVLGYGIMMCSDTILLYRYFPHGERGYYRWLRWIDQYKALVIIGFFTNLGLFAHLVIAWFSQIGNHITTIFYSAPVHDISALFAFMTILLTTINFVATTEVNFYPVYKRYYSLFNGNGSITEIDFTQEEMLKTLEREIAYLARRQFYFSILLIALGPLILDSLPLGFTENMNSYFRLLCVGYCAYSIANSLMLLEMYFADYHGAAICSIVFGLSVPLFSVLSLLLPVTFYGIGFVISSILYLGCTWYYLNSFTSGLPYKILSNARIIDTEKNGLFTRLSKRLDRF